MAQKILFYRFIFVSNQLPICGDVDLELGIGWHQLMPPAAKLVGLFGLVAFFNRTWQQDPADESG
jgi:hypothetical protein